MESNCSSKIKTPANVSSTTKQSASTNSFPLYKVASENGELLNSQITQPALPNMPLNKDNNLDNFSVLDDKSQNSSNNFEQVKKVKLTYRDNCKTE